MYGIEMHTVDNARHVDEIFFDVPTLHEAKTKVMEWAEKKTNGDQYRLLPTKDGTAGKVKLGDRLIGFYFIWED